MKSNTLKSNTMKINKRGDVVFLTFPGFDKIDFIRHGVSTRHGGVSKGNKTASMNLGLKTDDSIETVKENFKIFCSSAELNYSNLTLANQSHSSNIRIITKEDIGKGLHKERDYYDVDGIITDMPDVPLMIHTADCVPVIFADTEKRIIGALHAGWRGSFENISTKMIECFKRDFGSDTENIIAGICPSIGPCCYNVSEELFNQFKEKYFSIPAFIIKDHKYYIDLKELNRQQLINSGIKSANIFVSDICTKCNNKDFFSHRILGDGRGMIGTFISLK